MAQNNRSATKSHLHRAWTHVWPENIGSYILVAIALLLATLNLLDFSAASVTLAITLSVLSLFVISLIRDRVERRSLVEEIRRLASTHAHGSADHFFTRETAEHRILSRSKFTARAMQETGSLLLERAQDQISRLLCAGGSVKLLVTLPQSRQTSYLAFRNANLVSQLGIESRLNQFSEQVAGLVKNVGDCTSALEVRYTAYDCGYTSIIADGAPGASHSSGGLALIRLSGYRIPYKEKLDFLVEETDSPDAFRHFLEEFDDLFCCSTKILLVSAEPKAGKTKVFQDLLASHTESDDLFFAISESIWEGERRSGFAVRTSLDPTNPKRFALLKDGATKVPGDISKYELDTAVWDEVGREIAVAHSEGKILVIDEIGEMQLKSSAFRASISNIIDDPRSTLLATIPSQKGRDVIIERLFRSVRSTSLTLERNGEARLLEELKRELAGSIRLGRYLAGKN